MNLISVQIVVLLWMHKTMSKEWIINMLLNEKRCVETAEKGCDRDCSKCCLVMNSEDIIKAYDEAIKIIKEKG